MRFLWFVLFVFSPSLEAAEVCTADSQRVFCRLLRCVEGTHWDSQKVLDPIQVIKKDNHFSYEQILMPMGHTARTIEFHLFSATGVKTYSFPESVKPGVKCDKGKESAFVPLKGRCLSGIPFGLGCLFSNPSILKISPYRISYWDGKRVNYLCTELLKEAETGIKLSEKLKPIEEMAKIATPLLKVRMKQLARTIKTDEKSIDPQRIITSIKNGESLEDMGDCRYFLDGNTLNLIIEALEKKYPQVKVK